jgi:hypothetical protein
MLVQHTLFLPQCFNKQGYGNGVMKLNLDVKNIPNIIQETESL